MDQQHGCQQIIIQPLTPPQSPLASPVDSGIYSPPDYKAATAQAGNSTTKQALSRIKQCFRKRSQLPRPDIEAEYGTLKYVRRDLSYLVYLPKFQPSASTFAPPSIDVSTGYATARRTILAGEFLGVLAGHQLTNSPKSKRFIKIVDFSAKPVFLQLDCDKKGAESNWAKYVDHRAIFNHIQSTTGEIRVVYHDLAKRGPKVGLWARRTIEFGEKITIDYNLYQD